ncbi:hypothetical protein OHA98_42390 [Streptomyces sp. NBC_00654]|uniref:hypothetical protein n=1 Tax=Streptomyces sp. NBC_00654 TaxID=2975799 RepID=UPI00224F2B9D|nr:hypothetical protein [Streptomyces sp. NBC_00654]MCX4971251.1 hypothetical protein [Streptomyces sp. NBC_00654]
MTLTLDQFRDQHGDPIVWCAADIDSYIVLGEITPPPPTLYSYAEMQVLAADHLWSAGNQQAVADRLAAAGHDIAAGIWTRGARESRELAAAARFGWPHYEAVLNGW